MALTAFGLHIQMVSLNWALASLCSERIEAERAKEEAKLPLSPENSYSTKAFELQKTCFCKSFVNIWGFTSVSIGKKTSPLDPLLSIRMEACAKGIRSRI